MNSKKDTNGNIIPAAVAIVGDLSGYGVEYPCEQLATVPTTPKAQEDTVNFWSFLSEMCVEEVLFERSMPILPEEAFYISEALGDQMPNWGSGRYVIDAGTGAGKTTAIMNLLGKIVSETPEFEVEGRKRILYLCNRIPLKEQIIEAVFGDDVERDFRDYDRLFWDRLLCRRFSFIEIWTYQKLQKEYQNNPEGTLEFVKRCYTYIVCDEAHYFFNDAKFNHKTDIGYRCVEQLVPEKTVIYMSATMQPLIQKWKEEGSIAPEHYYRIPRRRSCVSEVRFYYRDAEREGILDAIPVDEKIVVFVTSRTSLEKMKQRYGSSASYYCSRNNQGGAMDALEDCIKGKKLLKRILFTTTALYNGVDIKDKTVKHIFIEQWMPIEIVQEIGRKRPEDESDTCKLYLRGRGKRELESRLKEAYKNLEPALYYHMGGEAWEKFLASPDINDRIGEESVLKYNHQAGAYEINEMKEMLFLYQKGIIRQMLSDGYHDALLRMLWDDLGGRIPEYKSDGVSAYIAEHLHERMQKKRMQADLIRLLCIVPAKGRSSREPIGRIILNRELQKYEVKIESGQGTAGEWRNKTFWELVELP